MIFDPEVDFFFVAKHLNASFFAAKTHNHLQCPKKKSISMDLEIYVTNFHSLTFDGVFQPLRIFI